MSLVHTSGILVHSNNTTYQHQFAKVIARHPFLMVHERVVANHEASTLGHALMRQRTWLAGPPSTSTAVLP